MMKFSEFKQFIAENIKDYLPIAEFGSCTAEIVTVTKNNGSYEGLTMKPKGEPVPCPVFNLTQAFKQYQNGSNLDEIFEEGAKVLTTTCKPSIDVSSLRSFEANKDKVFPRLVNISNSDYLAGKPYKAIEGTDICAVYYISLGDGATATIDDNFLDLWGIDLDTLDSKATENLCELGYKIAPLMSAAFGHWNTIDEIDITDDFPFYAFTTSDGCLGASVILNEDLMKKLTDKLGAVYVIPSSIHEVIVLPKAVADKFDNVEGLVENIKEVNSTMETRDILSDTLYMYDSKLATVEYA